MRMGVPWKVSSLEGADSMELGWLGSIPRV
jgi:hypothetical protein